MIGAKGLIFQLGNGITVALVEQYPSSTPLWRGLVVHSTNPAFPVGDADHYCRDEALAHAEPVDVVVRAGVIEP